MCFKPAESGGVADFGRKRVPEGKGPVTNVFRWVQGMERSPVSEDRMFLDGVCW